MERTFTRRRRIAAAAGTCAVAGAVVASVVATGQPVAAAIALNPRGSVVVTYRGNGHGHGLSQYGAYGAALAGRSYAQILAGYYPGTTLTHVRVGAVRVLLSNTGAATTVTALPSLQVSGVAGYLQAKGNRAYRLVTDAGSTLTLQRLSAARGATWTTIRTGLADGSQFSRPDNAVTRLILTDGTSTDYYGRLRAVRAAARGASGGVHTVNVVGYNAYAAGVAPREMPASWSPAATAAQAVAARTYALYEKAHAGSGSYYDLCDTSSCQVYGGHQHYTSSGAVAWTDLLSAATSTMNAALTYQGAVILAQYSASNGGWSTAGGEPYLRAMRDPYDPGRSGDPYVGAHETVGVATLARAAGLSTATGFAVTQRDGNGTWGGRIVTATVSGTLRGKPASRTVSGYDLADAFGLGTTWIYVAPVT